MSDVKVEGTPSVGVRWHEYADLFPWIEGRAREELKADIAKNGVLEPVVFLDGAILDGRNRYAIARELGIEYPRVEYDGDDPLGFVIAKNLARRHLDSSQRAMVAKRIATTQQGERRDLPANEGKSLSQEEAAEVLNVSVASVERASTVIEKGAPELVAAVDSGKVSVSAAADVATLPKTEQAEIVAKGEKEILAAAKAIRAQKQSEKTDNRANKEAALAEAIRNASETLGQGRYGVIYADPPWRFEPYSRQTGMDRAADNHYPTMLLDDIAAMDIPAAEDCVLFLWATSPMLREAMAVIEAWGFTYKSQIVWLKDRIGTGYWARNKHEILLIATKGNVPAPEPGTQSESVIAAPVGEHSAKPAAFAELIERLFPNLPKIELFARTARLGWASWGAEANPDPHLPGVIDGHPSIPSSPAKGAKTDGVTPVDGQVGHEPSDIYLNGEQEDASALRARNESGSESGATVDYRADGGANIVTRHININDGSGEAA